MNIRRMGIAVALATGCTTAAFGSLVSNADFEAPAAADTVPGWTWDRDDSVAKVSVAPGGGIAGSHALFIDKRSSERSCTVCQRIAVRPGRHYRLTCRIRTEDFVCRNVDLTGAMLGIRHVVGGKPVHLPQQDSCVTTETSGGWARMVAHIDPPANADGFADIRLWIHFSVTGRFYFDNFTLEERSDPAKPPSARAETPLVDEANRLLVDGKPFLPLGFYVEAWDPFTVSNLDLVASGPYNTLVPYSFPDRRQMDLCAARGLRVLYNANVYYGTRWAFGKVKSEAEEDDWTARTIASFKDHPALLGWYVNDEFNFAFRDRLLKRNALVKSLDPKHVTWGVYMEPRDSRWFLDCHDVMGVDPYPISGNGPEMNLMCVHDYSSRSLAEVTDTRAVWQVIQVFDWGMFSTEFLRKGSRPPTRDEISAMTQLAIAGGANGIFYLSVTALASPVNGAKFSERWAAVLAAANEVKANESTILSPPGPAVMGVSAPELRVRTWNAGGKEVALVVNGSYRSVCGTVRCADRTPIKVALGPLAHGYYILQNEH